MLVFGISYSTTASLRRVWLLTKKCVTKAAGRCFSSEKVRRRHATSVIAFSVPESSREIRDMFRSRLRWRGLAPLYGALWVSPRGDAEELEENCASFGVEDYVIFRTADQTLRGKSLITAWSPRMAMDAWRAFPWNDPDLPAELLPKKWPLAEARKIFVRMYDGLAVSALAQVEAIVADTAPPSIP